MTFRQTSTENLHFGLTFSDQQHTVLFRKKKKNYYQFFLIPNVAKNKLFKLISLSEYNFSICKNAQIFFLALALKKRYFCPVVST